MGNDLKTNSRLVFGFIESHFLKTKEKLSVGDIVIPGINIDDVQTIIYSLANRGKIEIDKSSIQPYITKIIN